MLTERFADAFSLAERLHRAQVRKGSTIPYISHPMAVASLVLEHHGGEDAAVAALLHDAVEDQGGWVTAEQIRQRFGARVVEIVLACTDAMPAEGEAKPPWRARKEAFIARLAQADPESALVIACDKLHNLSALAADLERDGPATLNRFNQPEQLAWYFAAILEALAPLGGQLPLDALRFKLAAFIRLASADHRTDEGANGGALSSGA
jgi:(p)ppGpp synthase/HD superfamily hydrolase